MLKRVVLLVLAVALLAGCVQETKEPDSAGFWVLRAVDGDTIELAGGQFVRLLGINTPERGMPCYNEAKEFLQGKAAGKKVTLEFDTEKTDRYGRWLAHAFSGNKNLNVEIVDEGLAFPYFLGNNRKYEQEITGAKKNAEKMAESCLWKRGNGCMELSSFSLSGNEFIEFENNCGYAIGLNGWLLHDIANNKFVFPHVEIGGNEKARLYSAEGTNSGNSIYWGEGNVWNNEGDSYYLRDSNMLLADYGFLAPENQ